MPSRSRVDAALHISQPRLDRYVPDSIQEARWLTPWAAQLRYEMLEPLNRDVALSVAIDAVEWASALSSG